MIKNKNMSDVTHDLYTPLPVSNCNTFLEPLSLLEYDILYKQSCNYKRETRKKAFYMGCRQK